MLAEKIAALFTDRTDFNDQDLENAVKDSFAKIVAASMAGFKLEQSILNAFPGDSTNQAKFLAISEGVVDLASQIGVAFNRLDETQREVFKTLFASVFELENDEIELAGEELFNASVNGLAATQALNEYVESISQDPV